MNFWAFYKNQGAINPLMDPFKMEAKREILPDYKADMCLETLDLLSKAVYAKFFDPTQSRIFPKEDFFLCVDVDKFDFAIRYDRKTGRMYRL